jgi:hypothetical protein
MDYLNLKGSGGDTPNPGGRVIFLTSRREIYEKRMRRKAGPLQGSDNNTVREVAEVK